MAGAWAKEDGSSRSKLIRVESRRWREGPSPSRKSPLMDQVVPAWRTAEYFMARIEEQIYRGRWEKKPFAVLWARIPEREPNDVISLLDLSYVMELIENDALRPNDIVCLLATNEIGVLIADSALENLEEFAELVADCFDDNVRPSFGIAVYARHGESASQLIERAKQGLPRERARVLDFDRSRRRLEKPDLLDA